MTLKEFKYLLLEKEWGKKLSSKDVDRRFKQDIVRGYGPDRGKSERRAMWGYDLDEPDKSKSMHSESIKEFGALVRRKPIKQIDPAEFAPSSPEFEDRFDETIYKRIEKKAQSNQELTSTEMKFLEFHPDLLKKISNQYQDYFKNRPLKRF